VTPLVSPPPPPAGVRSAEQLAAVVEQLCANSGLVRHSNHVPCAEPLPVRDRVHEIVEALRTVLFPGYFGASEVRRGTLRFHIGHTLDWVERELEQQIKRGLAFVCDGETDEECSLFCDSKAAPVTVDFLERLPEIQRLVGCDVQAAYEGDPAARSPGEAIFSYPGLLAVTNYRIAHELFCLEVPVLPRMITEYAHSTTGIDIHPGAVIGSHFFIDHGTGVVIGETCVIGDRVQLYQGVTLGAKSFPLDADGNPIKGIPRHPILQDKVIVYSGATILGRVTIGEGSVIGGNVWLTRSIPAGSRITIQPVRRETFESGGGI